MVTEFVVKTTSSYFNDTYLKYENHRYLRIFLSFWVQNINLKDDKIGIYGSNIIYPITIYQNREMQFYTVLLLHVQKIKTITIWWYWSN